MTQPDFQNVLGVIDLKDGRAVHAVAGNRSQYQPVSCRFTQTGDAIALARGYIGAGTGGLYVADLDAIENTGFNGPLIHSLADLGVETWVDAGLCQAALQPHDVRIRQVVGTESLSDLNPLTHLQSPILSIDLRQGQVQAKSPTLRNRSPVHIVEQALAMGTSSFIILELCSVGGARDPQVASICKQINSQHPEAKIATGGGIRTVKDMSELQSVGCERFLIGTGLHEGRKNFLIGSGSC